MTDEHRLAHRWAFAIVVGSMIGAATYAYWTIVGDAASDLDQLWLAARALLHGSDPYKAVSPAVSPWPLIYPLPAVFLAIPFAWLPLPIARASWFAAGAGCLAWAWSQRPTWRSWGFMSGAFIWCAMGASWTPLIVAGVWVPAVRFWWCVKPNTGLLLWVREPRMAPLIGGSVLVGVSFVVAPGWIGEWIANILHPAWGFAYHPIPITMPGGWLLLLALLRWRDPGARVVAAWSLLPSSIMPSELLLGYVVARSRREWLVVTVTSWLVVAYAARLRGAVPLPGETSAHAFARWAGNLWPAILTAWLVVLVIVLWRNRRLAAETPSLVEAASDV